MCDSREYDAFTTKFKYFKSKTKKPSFKDVLSNNGDCTTGLSIVSNNVIDNKLTHYLGLKPYSDWKLYKLEANPGLLFIKNPFTALGQRFWIRKCLEIYPRKPHKMNLDIEMEVKDWWAQCHKNEVSDKVLRKKLRWTTLGYHHNWDTKVYSEENRTEFPKELAELTDIIAEYLGYKQYKSEAAIVNYYHMGSTLSAHTDHSEIDLEAPLFSFSFGQSAIFLIGGTDKSVDPSAILLESGDIVIMSKEARLCYHAVPKILPAASSPWNKQDELYPIHIDESDLELPDSYEEIAKEINLNCESKEWDNFESYISESRINVNVRQVLKKDQNKLYS